MKRLSISFLFIIFSLSFLAQASVPEGRASFAQRSYNIVFIGNSITYGALHQQRELTAPPVQCARWFTQRDDIDSVYIANCGRSGRTTYHFLPNAADVIPAGDKTYFGDVVAKTRQLVKTHPGLPLVFSIMLGTNDTVERTKNRHTTPDAYVKNLTVIIDSLLRLWPDAHVVLNKPTWYYPDYHTKGGSVATKNSLKLITTYYEQFPKIVANSKPGHVHIGDAEAYGYFEKHYKTDVFEEKDARGQSYWLHPNEQGAAKLGEYWGKAILPVLKSATTAQMPQFQQEFGNPRKTFVETVAMPDHADSRYVVGQQATLRITAREGGVPLNGTTLYYKTAPEMFLPEAYDSTTFVNGEALVRMGTMTEPGFLACQYAFTAADGKKYGDLVKLAFSPEQIKSFTPMPTSSGRQHSRRPERFLSRLSTVIFPVPPTTVSSPAGFVCVSAKTSGCRDI